MGVLIDGIIAIPIGLIYNMIVHKIGEIFNDNINYKDKIQRNLLLSFGGGALGIIVAYTLFGSGKYKNRAIRFGLYLGSIILLLHSVGYNWTVMDNESKIIIMVITLGILMWYTYHNLDSGIKVDDSSYYNSDKPNYLPATYTRYSEPFNDDDDHDDIIDYNK